MPAYVRLRTDATGMACDTWHAMRRRPSIPRKNGLVKLFTAAKRRLTTQTDDVAALRNVRIASATRELNRITDDIRDAHRCQEPVRPAIPPRRVLQLAIFTVGKILRRTKADR